MSSRSGVCVRESLRVLVSKLFFSYLKISALESAPHGDRADMGTVVSSMVSRAGVVK
jgi:hypothetical protein